MKFLLFVFYFFVLANSVYGETCNGINVGSTIFKDTTWSAEKSPYCLSKDVTIIEEAVLKIKPGTVIKLYPNVSIRVFGEINANGTKEKMVLFTSTKSSDKTKNWGSIYFLKEAKEAIFNENLEYQKGSIFEYTIFENGGAKEAAILLDKSPYFINSTFRNNTRHAILAKSKTIIEKSLFKNNTSGGFGAALRLERSSSHFINNSTFIENEAFSGGAISVCGKDVRISNSTFEKNRSTREAGAIFANCNSMKLLIEKSNFIGNSTRGNGGAFFLSTPTSTTITNSNFIGNEAYNGSAIFGQDGFILDKSLVQNNFGETAIFVIPGRAPGIIKNSTIVDNYSQKKSKEPGIGIFARPARFIAKYVFEVLNSNIIGHSYNLYNDGDFDINAQKNYWGTDDPEIIFERQFDKYDDTSKGKIDFGIKDNNFLTDYSPGTPQKAEN